MNDRVVVLEGMIADAERRIGQSFVGMREVNDYMINQAKKIVEWTVELDELLKTGTSQDALGNVSTV